MSEAAKNPFDSVSVDLYFMHNGRKATKIDTRQNGTHSSGASHAVDDHVEQLRTDGARPHDDHGVYGFIDRLHRAGGRR
jgi:hypothetical protein